VRLFNPTATAYGPIPKRRSGLSQLLRMQVCLLRGHRDRAWLAPPGVKTPDGHAAYSMVRCYRCGGETAH
jgi:hypothetical protein